VVERVERKVVLVAVVVVVVVVVVVAAREEVRRAARKVCDTLKLAIRPPEFDILLKLFY
jgi:hypothetical protein